MVPENLFLRLCLYYVVMVAIGFFVAFAYTGVIDPSLWSQNVRTAIVLVPAGFLSFIFMFALL